MGRRLQKGFLILNLLAIGSTLAGAEPRSLLVPPQEADSAFNARVAQPAYIKKHPRVLFDHAHNNAGILNGSYKPFGDLVTSDGYSVVPGTTVLSRRVLSQYDVLIVVNASGPAQHKDAPAFSEGETAAVRDWVRGGGALLLISDHAPFSAAVDGLLKQFDVDIVKGFTIDSVHHNKDSGDETELVFSRDNGLLGEHPITRGRNPAERVNRIITFSGTSLKGPVGSDSFLRLADTAKDIFPSADKPASPEEAAPDPKQVSAGGRAQGLAMVFGKGRVVVLSEAAMLTAQVALRGFRFGMNLPGYDNRQLALNVMHWLSRLF